MVWSRTETEEQLQAVEQLLRSMVSPRDIEQVLRKKFGPVGRIRTMRLIARTYERWREDDKNAVPHQKAAQSRRIAQYLQQARGVFENGRWTVKPDWKAVAMFENILADVQGTRAPIEVNVDARVSQSLQAIIASMTPEQMAERLAVVRQRRELAEQARRPPEPPEPPVTVQ